MKDIRLLPPFVTLLAGAITSITMYLLKCELLQMLIVLLIVIVIFYVLGVIAMRIIQAYPNKKTEGVSDEGEVIEKENQDQVQKEVIEDSEEK